MFTQVSLTATRNEPHEISPHTKALDNVNGSLDENEVECMRAKLTHAIYTCIYIHRKTHDTHFFAQKYIGVNVLCVERAGAQCSSDIHLEAQRWHLWRGRPNLLCA